MKTILMLSLLLTLPVGARSELKREVTIQKSINLESTPPKTWPVCPRTHHSIKPRPSAREGFNMAEQLLRDADSRVNDELCDGFMI